ncbi:MAG: PQQ-binding-like beta-propeller repeat protein, partial [Thiohalomonadales bacterium]
MIKLNSIKNGILYTYILLLAGCGGGNGGGTSVVEDPGSPVQSVAITLTTTSLNNDLSAGDEIPVTLKGSWTGKNLGTDKVYLQARDVEGRFTTPLSFDGATGSEFSFSFLTQATLVAGTHNGAIEVRACKDAKCAKPYSKSSESIEYTLNVALVTDWETHQRDANHRGYIPILLNPEKFKKVWQWQREPDASDPIGGINAVVTSNGKVYITTDVYFGLGILYALNEIDGTEAWRVSFGKVPALNPPAVSKGAVYAATTGHQDTFLWAFNADTGKFKHKSAFSGQWPHVLAPTVYGDQVYTGSGYYGGDIYSFST